MAFLGGFWKKDSADPEKVSSLGRWHVGDTIARGYEIRHILGGEGKSGMGIVYICYGGYGPKENPRNYYALKTFQDKWLSSKESQKLFEQEALVWVNLGICPYIVHANWVERIDDRLFITLEYITPDQQGRNNLTHYLGNLTFPEIVKYCIQFCYGMEYAYSKGIDAHRDIKPDNIMITSNSILKITDFGLTKVSQEMEIKEDIISSGKETGLSVFKTKAGKRVCGTLPYMSPEQFDGYADKRSDIYAFGITLYQMITGGQLPFVSKDRTPEKIQVDYERLHKYEKVPLISSPIFSLIQKCLEKDPNKRYQDFVSIREQLQRLLLKETGETFTPHKNIELNVLEWYFKALSLRALGRNQEAIVCCDKAIEIEAIFAEAWCVKGNALGELGRYKEAIACFDKATDKDSGFAEAWNNKAIALESLGRYSEAIPCREKAVFAWNKLGILLEKLGKYKEAISNYDKALEIDPNNISAQNNKKLCLEKYGRKEG